MARVNYPASSYDDVSAMGSYRMAPSPTARDYYTLRSAAQSPNTHAQFPNIHPHHHYPHPHPPAHPHAHALVSPHPHSPYSGPPSPSIRYAPYTLRPSYSPLPASYHRSPPPSPQRRPGDQWVERRTGNVGHGSPLLDVMADRARAAEMDYEAAKPTQRYQLSRGAQRDAKYLRRVRLEQEAFARWQTPPETGGRAEPAGYSGGARLGDRVGQGQLRLIRGPVDDTEQERTRKKYQMMQEQQEQIARAQYEYGARRQAETTKKNEMMKKMKTVQMQAFVHARRTPCAWGDCDAELTSWSLLEKHIYHAHLHPRKKLPDEKSGVRCHWENCEMVFPDRDKCYNHALIVHMRRFSARCPFNCLFEGTDIVYLMAHIERRHPSKTPDDFVPALRPCAPYVPPLETLPQLPTFVDYLSRYLDGPVRPYPRGVKATRGQVSRMAHGKINELPAEPLKDGSASPTRKGRNWAKPATPSRRWKQSPKSEAKKQKELTASLAEGISEALRKAKQEHEERLKLGMLTPGPSEGEDDADWWKKELTEVEMREVDEQTMPLLMKLATKRRALREEEVAEQVNKGKRQTLSLAGELEAIL